MKRDPQTKYFLASALDANLLGLQALKTLVDGNDLLNFVNFLYECKGKIIFCGVGKSGVVSDKISSMLMSFGIESVSLSPMNAIHGDLGLIKPDDIVVFLSNSGLSSEISPIIDFCKSNKVQMSIITRNSDEFIKQIFQRHLILPYVAECDLEIPAPTVSTTMFFVVGDMIALALAKLHRLTPKQYSLFHPKGKIGLSLTPISKLSNTTVPTKPLSDSVSLPDLARVVNDFGFVAFVNSGNKFAGFITSFEILKLIQEGPNPTISPYIISLNLNQNTSIYEAKEVFKTNSNLNWLILTDTNNEITGSVNRLDVMTY